jgi:hypothetical protein
MSDYFEGQNDKDCVIHSFNNAFGMEMVTKEHVLKYIDKKVEKEIQRQWKLDPNMTESEASSKRKKMRSKYSSGETFFTADIVWEYARSKGMYKVHSPIPGFTTPYLRMEALTTEVLSHPIVLLGGNGKKETHAIAIRDGHVYDSERAGNGRKPLTKNEILRSLRRVFGAFVFLNDAKDVSSVRRSLEVSAKPQTNRN